MDRSGHIEVNPDALHWLGGFENSSDATHTPNNTNQQTCANPKQSSSLKSSIKSKSSNPIKKPKKILSYAERFALEHGAAEPKIQNNQFVVQPVTTNRVSTDRVASLHNNNYEPLEPDADILVITSEPSTPYNDYEDDLEQTCDRAIPVHNTSYDDNYSDFHQDEYPMDDQFCITSEHQGYNEQQSSSPLQQKTTFKRYTLNDYKHLPKEVKLGTLGSSADPAKLAEVREKQRAAKQLADKIRLTNLKRAQLNQSDERKVKDKDVAQPKPKSKREIAAEFAKKVPKPRVPMSNSNSHHNQSTSDSLKSTVADDNDDEIQEMIRQQEARRRNVTKIKASLGIPT